MKKLVFVNLLDLENMYVRAKQIGQLSLYNIIKASRKWDADIWDANYLYLKKKLKLYSSNEYNYQIMANDILEKKPTYISIYTMCNNYHQALSLAKIIKEIEPKIIIIFAGPQASMVAYKTMEKFKFIDYIALGEGENTIINIMEFIDERLQKKNNIKSIKGLAYRDNKGCIIESWNRDNYCNLDQLEPLRYEVVDEDIYDGNSVIDMEIGRGCPFSCTYCSTSMFWNRKFRVKSVNKVIEEIRTYIEKYNVKTFAFHHDLLTADKKYIMELSNALISNMFNIVWACYSRLDVIDNEMITIMAKAGCHQIYYGIETGSARMQNIINKNLQLEKIFQIMDSMIDNNIKAEFSFIIGYPQETREDLIQTIEYIKSIKEYEMKQEKRFVQIHIFQIMFFPKTSMTGDCFDDLVYNPYILEDSKIGNSLDILEEELCWVKENKEIFINYYNLQKNITEKARYMNLFLMMIFNYGYNYCIKLLEKIMEKVTFNILEIYEYIYENRKEELQEVLSYIYFNHKNEHNEICKKIRNLLSVFEEI